LRRSAPIGTKSVVAVIDGSRSRSILPPPLLVHVGDRHRNTSKPSPHLYARVAGPPQAEPTFEGLAVRWAYVGGELDSSFSHRQRTAKRLDGRYRRKSAARLT